MLPRSWFRVYGEIVDDEKLRLLAFEDRWHYVAILALKSRGILDSDDQPELLRRKVAVKLGLQLREVDEVARRLSEVGLIDAETLHPLKWNDRQFESDSSRERVRQYRERVKRNSNVTVTAQETETETETETEKSRDARPRRGTRLPPGEALTESLAAFCRTERPDLDPQRTWERFCDYWTAVPGAKGSKLDWPATWRNWVRSEKREPAGRQDAKRAGRESVMGAIFGNSNRREVIDVEPTVIARRLG